MKWWLPVAATAMIVLVHNILPPYRVPLFNSISDQAEGGFHVLLQRENHPARRKWTVPWDDVRFGYEMLPGWSLDARGPCARIRGTIDSCFAAAMATKHDGHLRRAWRSKTPSA